VYVCASNRPSAWNNSAPTGWIFVKFDVWVLFENLSRKVKFDWSLIRMTCNLHEELCTFFIMSLCIEKYFRQNLSRKSKHTFYIEWCFSKNRAVYEIMWKNMVQPMGDSIIWGMHFTCWITEVPGTCSEYVILNAFPWWWLRKHASLLFLYVRCLYCSFSFCGRFPWRSWNPCDTISVYFY
jgi:hypothetical protein